MTEGLLKGAGVVALAAFVLALQVVNFRRAARYQEIYLGRMLYRRADSPGWFRAACIFNAMGTALMAMIGVGGLFLFIASLAGWDQ